MKTNKTIRFNFSKSIASKSKCYIVIKMFNGGRGFGRFILECLFAA